MVNEIKKRLVNPATLITSVAGFLFLLLQSVSTSPLFTWSYIDSTIFRLMGLSLVRGGNLYLTTMDSKGPVLFFIEALGAWISSGRIGIFLVQYLFLLVTLFSILFIAQNFVSKRIAWIFPIVYLCFYGFAFEGGNLGEEFSLSFVMLGLYLLIYLFKRGSLSTFSKRISSRRENELYFLLGILSALIFFIRANNVASITAGLLVLIFFTLRQLGIRKATVAVVYIASGFVVITSILLLYFALHHSLQAMIYGTFIFNLKYSMSGAGGLLGVAHSSFAISSYVVTFISLATAFLYYAVKKDSKITSLLIFVAIFSNLAIFVSGQTWLHYLQLLMPPLIFSLMLLADILKEISPEVATESFVLGVGIVAIIIMTLVDVSVFYKYNFEKKVDKLFEQNSIQVIERVPLAQRNDIYSYNINPLPFVLTSVTPSKRLTALQDWMGEHDPTFRSEVRGYFINNPPKWLILTPTAPPRDSFISRFIAENYHQVYSNESYTLDHLNSKY